MWLDMLTPFVNYNKKTISEALDNVVSSEAENLEIYSLEDTMSHGVTGC